MKTLALSLSLLLGAWSIGAVAAPAGALDPTFDMDGRQSIAFDLGEASNGSNIDRAYAMARAPGGRTYLAGAAFGPDGRPVVAITRLAHDGTLDPDFGIAGRKIYPDLFYQAQVLDAVLTADNRLLVVGSTRLNNLGADWSFACRFMPDGEPDLEFGPLEIPGCNVVGPIGAASAVALQSDGKVLMGGYTIEGEEAARGMVIRLDPNGLVDQKFGLNGVVRLPESMTTQFRDIVQLSTGKIVAAGVVMVGNPAQDDFIVASFNEDDGSPNLAFDGDGMRVIPIDIGPAGFRNDVATALLSMPAGEFMLAGHAQRTKEGQHRPVIMRLDSNGVLNPKFGNGGMSSYNPCGAMVGNCDMKPTELLPGSNGGVVLVGGMRTAEFSRFFALRVLEHGEQDATFGDAIAPLQQGFVMPSFALVPQMPDASAQRVVAQGARILLGGYVEAPQVGNNPASNYDFAAIRLDHGLDASFVVTPVVTQGGSLSPADKQSVAHSDISDFVVTPDLGYKLAQINGCGGALYGTVFSTDPVIADCTVTAQFTLDLDDDLFVVKPVAGLHGALSPDVTQVVVKNAVLKFIATPDAGFEAQVSGCDGVLDGNVYSTAPIASDCEVVANFVEAQAGDLIDVGVNIGANGKMTPDMAQSVPKGSVLQFLVSPNQGFDAQVAGCGGSLVSNVFTTAPVNADCEVTANFVPKVGGMMFDVTTSVGPDGLMTPSGTQTVGAGSVLEFTLTPTAGFYAQVNGCGGVLNGNSYLTAPISEDCEVVATFLSIPVGEMFDVSTSVGPNGSMTPNATQTVAGGSILVFTVLPESGFKAQVSGCGGSLNGNTYTTAVIVADCQVTADFTPITGSIFADSFEN